jgi:hypothetical protein
MSFEAELEIEVTLSPLPPLLDLLDSVIPYHNSSPLESKPRGISLLEGKILCPNFGRIKQFTNLRSLIHIISILK